MKNRINLETMNDIKEFVAITSQIPHKVFLTNSSGLKVSAKSVLGVIASMTFKELYVECDENIYKDIEKFIRIETNMQQEITPIQRFWQDGFIY